MNKRPLCGLHYNNQDSIPFKIGGYVYINEDGKNIKGTIEQIFPHMILCNVGDRRIGVPKGSFVCGDARVIL